MKHYLALIAVTYETAPTGGIFNQTYLRDSTTVYSASWNQSTIDTVTAKTKYFNI